MMLYLLYARRGCCVSHRNGRRVRNTKDWAWHAREPRDDATTLVASALAEGFRHIDTAEYYGNEEPVGKALAMSSVPRSDIWLTTKVLHPKAPTPADVRSAAEASLRRLGVDYVDALLIHWPNPLFDHDEALRVFAELRDEGKVRTIGVSNFPSEFLRDVLSHVDLLFTNQVEYHPFLDQSLILGLLRDAGSTLTAHTPLARGRVLEDPVILQIAADRGQSPAQVALRWLVQQDRVIAIPGSSPGSVGHLRENLAVLDLQLTDEEMSRISALSDKNVRVVSGDHAPAWDA